VVDRSCGLPIQQQPRWTSCLVGLFVYVVVVLRTTGSHVKPCLAFMYLEFRTKAEANKAQREAFLALSGEERMAAFFALSRKIMREYPSLVERSYGNNLMLEFPKEQKIRTQ